jgi:hypothetical protein
MSEELSAHADCMNPNILATMTGNLDIAPIPIKVKPMGMCKLPHTRMHRFQVLARTERLSEVLIQEDQESIHMILLTMSSKMDSSTISRGWC